MTRTRSLALGVALAIAVSCAGLVIAKPISYRLPDETATLKPAPGVDAVRANCSACHSSDYIETQPRTQASKRDFWQTEVTKMIKLYGAPIDEGDVGKIVDYLTANY